MFSVKEKLQAAKDYIVEDYNSSKFRFFLEVYTLAVSLITSIVFATTVPNIPVVQLYSLYITGCLSALYCAWTRGSFGLLINYLILVSIDTFGLIRFLLGNV